MAVKEMSTFTKFTVEDLGLRSTDTDAHVPQFFMLKKWPATQPANSRAFHTKSTEAQERDLKRRKQSRRWKRQAEAMARKAEAAAAAAAEVSESDSSNTLELVDRSPGSSMSSGLEPAGQEEKGKGKGNFKGKDKDKGKFKGKDKDKGKLKGKGKWKNKSKPIGKRWH